MVDITKIKNLVREKEILLHESQHRIKNNLASLQALLNLHAKTLGDSPAAAALMDAASRLNSIALLYTRLYKTAEDDFLHLGDYTKELVASILEAHPRGGQVDWKVSLGNISLSVKVLSSLGIILNEIITNIMKHAFADTPQPRILITGGSSEGRRQILIKDNGSGFSREARQEAGDSFGLTLIEGLCEELGIQCSLKSQPGRGTEVTLTLPEGIERD